jgi:hypothetical protein
MTWLMLFFECLKNTALYIASLDYIYIEWIINLSFPFILFLILLFAVPIVMITCMFGIFFFKFNIKIIFLYL